MDKFKYIKLLDNFLSQRKYNIIEDSPITKSNKLVWELKNIDGFRYVLKITNDDEEIKAAKKLKGFKSSEIANIILVKDVIDFHIIIVEKIEPLSNVLIKSIKRFNRVFKRWFIFHLIIKKISFGLINLKLDNFTFLFSYNTLFWVDRFRDIKIIAKQSGINNPSDYMDPTNLGIKMDKIAAFDIRDDKNSLLYEHI